MLNTFVLTTYFTKHFFSLSSLHFLWPLKKILVPFFNLCVRFNLEKKYSSAGERGEFEMSMQFWDTLELERNGMTFSENGKLAEIQGGSRDLQHASVALFAE